MICPLCSYEYSKDCGNEEFTVKHFMEVRKEATVTIVNGIERNKTIDWIEYDAVSFYQCPRCKVLRGE